MADGESNGRINQLLLSELRQLKQELSDSRAHIMDIKTDIASLKSLYSDMKYVKHRLNKVESTDVVTLDTRLDSLERKSAVLEEKNLGSRVSLLEKNEYRRQGMSAVIAVLCSAAVAALMKWLLGA